MQPPSGASPPSPSSSFSSGDGGDSVDLARPAEEGADLAVYTIDSGGNNAGGGGRGGGGKRCVQPLHIKAELRIEEIMGGNCS